MPLSTNPPGDGRRDDETEDERVARNWDEILQELRVTQTGTQILLGFLLTIPFQQRFTELAGTQIIVYLSLVGAAAVATILAIAPVALHRALFRRGAKPQLVATANALMRLALAAIALALSGTVFLIFDVVLGHSAALIAGAATLLLTGIMWAVLPSFLRTRG
ncbi:DUF6328 family protein [Pseudolysinimonas sp.]|jgi:hypothetical protein